MKRQYLLGPRHSQEQRSLGRMLTMEQRSLGRMLCDNLTVLAALAVLSLALSSCNVTRTVTTRSEAWQHGDTSIVIQTKTVESYDGTRK